MIDFLKLKKILDTYSDRDLCFTTTKIIKEKTGDSELCLRISIQLQEYARLIKIEKEYIVVRNKPISQLLREAADYLS